MMELRHLEMQQLLADGWSVIQIARKYGTHRQSVYQAIERRRRLHSRDIPETLRRLASDSERPPGGAGGKEVSVAEKMTPMSESARLREGRRLRREAREKRNQEIFVMSAGGVSNDQLSRHYGLSEKQIQNILRKRVLDLRKQGLGNHMLMEAQRLTVVRQFLPGWTKKAHVEARDKNDRIGQATKVLLRLWEREAKYMGKRDTTHDPLEGVAGSSKVSKEVADEIGLALQQQLRFIMGILQDYPEARDAVVKALTRSLKPRGARAR